MEYWLTHYAPECSESLIFKGKKKNWTGNFGEQHKKCHVYMSLQAIIIIIDQQLYTICVMNWPSSTSKHFPQKLVPRISVGFWRMDQNPQIVRQLKSETYSVIHDLQLKNMRIQKYV